ncbi:MAG: DUF4252 domain-containing protein [Terriglobales bacterium]
MNLNPSPRFCAWRLALTLALALGLLLPLAAQTPQSGRLRLNLGHLAKRAAKFNQVTLSGAMLRSMAGNKTDPQAAAVLAHLQGIYIRELKFAKPGEYSPHDLRAITDQLSAPGWETIVRHRDAQDHKLAWIAVRRNSEGVITALAILDAAPTKLTVVNIVGPLPQGLGSLGALGALGNLGGGPAAMHHGPGHPMLQPRPAPTPAPAAGPSHAPQG